MKLTILSVAYPFAPVSAESVGGAEQVLSMLDQGLTAAGHRSIVVACEGSRPSGTLVQSVPRYRLIDDAVRHSAWFRHRKAIDEALDRWPVDLVHFHGHDFHAYLPQASVPALITLHLPLDHYPLEALTGQPPNTWLNCVSKAQHATRPNGANFLPPIDNAAPLDPPTVPHAKRDFALVIGRICPEKGIHLAIEAAERADISLLIAGEVFPYEAHLRYWREEVEPRLDRRRRFIGPVGPKRKRRLLAAARCVLIPSLIAETSSLVAREALICGTPVVAFPKGGLIKVIEHGRTGFFVDDIGAMAEAIQACCDLDPDVCREVGLRRFSKQRAVNDYLALYEGLAAAKPTLQAPRLRQRHLRSGPV